MAADEYVAHLQERYSDQLLSPKINFNSGKTVVGFEEYSNLAIHLAILYKTEKQKQLKTTFNELFSLIQGSIGATLFDEATPAMSKDATVERLFGTINYKYNSNINENGKEIRQEGSNVVADNNQISAERRRGFDSRTQRSKQSKSGSRTRDNRRGTDKHADKGEVDDTRLSRRVV